MASGGDAICDFLTFFFLRALLFLYEMKLIGPVSIDVVLRALQKPIIICTTCFTRTYVSRSLFANLGLAICSLLGEIIVIAPSSLFSHPL